MRIVKKAASDVSETVMPTTIATSAATRTRRLRFENPVRSICGNARHCRTFSGDGPGGSSWLVGRRAAMSRSLAGVAPSISAAQSARSGAFGGASR